MHLLLYTKPRYEHKVNSFFFPAFFKVAKATMPQVLRAARRSQFSNDLGAMLASAKEKAVTDIEKRWQGLLRKRRY